MGLFWRGAKTGKGSLALLVLFGTLGLSFVAFPLVKLSETEVAPRVFGNVFGPQKKGMFFSAREEEALSLLVLPQKDTLLGRRKGVQICEGSRDISQDFSFLPGISCF